MAPAPAPELAARTKCRLPQSLVPKLRPRRVLQRSSIPGPPLGQASTLTEPQLALDLVSRALLRRLERLPMAASILMVQHFPPPPRLPPPRQQAKRLLLQAAPRILEQPVLCWDSLPVFGLWPCRELDSMRIGHTEHLSSVYLSSLSTGCSEFRWWSFFSLRYDWYESRVHKLFTCVCSLL